MIDPSRYHSAYTMTHPAHSSSEPAWTERELQGDPHSDAEKSRRVQRMFSAIARRYDLNNRLHSFGRDQSWRRRAVKLAQIRPADEVLDVATGTGDLAEAFADAGAAKVVGLDFTPAMLELAERKAARRKRREGVTTPAYIRGDAMDMPLDDASFDVVSIAFGIRNMSDPTRALSEFRRVLRPGGRLVILEFTHPRNRLLRALNHFYCHQIMPRTATLIARDRSGAYRYLPRSVETFMSRTAMVEQVLAAGFADVSVHEQTLGVCCIYVSRVPGCEF